MVLKKKSINPNILWGTAVLCLFVVEALIWWPGVLRPDSAWQLAEVQSGLFSDANPPVMAFYWRFLHFLYPGSGLMLLSHLALFCGAVFCFGRCVSRNWKLFYIGLAFFPPIFSYAGFVLKDTGFAFSYLFCFSVLVFYTVHRKKFPWIHWFWLLPIAFYGSAVKYQAIFILPFLSFWIAYVIQGYRCSAKVAVQGITGFGFLFIVVTLFNNYSTQTKDHYWQYVKLYDLAAISLSTHQDLFPDFVKGPNFSMEKLSSRFNSMRVDELISTNEPVLIKSKTEAERKILWNSWFQAVRKFPGAYFQHRWAITKNLLSLSPIKSVAQIKSMDTQIVSPIRKAVLFLENSGLLKFFQVITAFYIYLPIMIFYILAGWFLHIRGNNVYAFSLAMLNTAGLALIGVLSIFSMAAEARYIYLSVCCFHMSHPLMFLCFRERLRPILGH